MKHGIMTIWGILLTGLLALGVSSCTKKNRDMVAGIFHFGAGLRDKNFDPNTDADHDGIPDLLEQKMGLNPDSADSDGDGVNDGDEDYDGDGLTTAQELELGFDPMLADSSSSQFPDNAAGDGVKDGDEDLDGDGVPISWELENNLDPTDGDDNLLDEDEDGFSNADEYAAGTDPNDSSDPENYLTLYDDDHDVANKTNAAAVRGTFDSCPNDEEVLISESNSQPDADAAGFTACSTTDYAASYTLTDLSEGSKTIYVWRKVDGVVRENPVRTTITVDTTAPTGTLTAPTFSTSATTIPVTITYPTDSDYDSLALYHLVGACSVTSVTGSLVSFPTGSGSHQEDMGAYTSASRHCFRVYFSDDVGNISSDTASNQEAESMTKSNPTPASCSDNVAQVCYQDQTANFEFSCDEAVQSLTDPNSSWAAGFTATMDSPSAGIGTISGTVGAAGFSSTARINSDSAIDQTFLLTVLGTAPTQTLASIASLSDNTTTAMAATSVLDAAWQCTSTSIAMKPLMGDAVTPATTSNGTVASTETSIPRLTYSDAGCTVSDPPTVCPGSSSFAGLTATSSMSLKWDYGPFDQGQYFIGVKNYLTLQNAKIYGTRKTNSIQVANPGSEVTLLTEAAGAATLSNNNVSSASIFSIFQPAVAFSNEATIDTAKQYFAAVFPSYNGTTRQFAGIGTVDRATSLSAITKQWFNLSTNADLTLSSEVSASTVSYSLAMEATQGGKWLTLGSQTYQAGPSNYVNMVARRLDKTTPSWDDTRVNLSALAVDTAVIDQIAITPYFTDPDDSGGYRHGVIFQATDPSDTTLSDLYMTKINGNGAMTKAGLLDAASWYDMASNHPMEGIIDSVRLTTDNGIKSMTKIAYYKEGVPAATNYFYGGWRDDNDSNKIKIVRVQAAAANTMTGPLSIVTSNQGDDTFGRPFYTISGGLADDAATNIVAVAYADPTDSGTAADRCKVAVANAGTMTLLGTNAISADTDCRFPHIFFNADANKFMVVYTLGSSNKVRYTEFTLDETTGAPVVTAGFPIDVTVRPDSTVNTNAIIKFAANYSASLRRIVMLGVEKNTVNTNMFVDFYKTYQTP